MKIRHAPCLMLVMIAILFGGELDIKERLAESKSSLKSPGSLAGQGNSPTSATTTGEVIYLHLNIEQISNKFQVFYHIQPIYRCGNTGIWLLSYN